VSTLLHLDTSPRPDAASRHLTAAFAGQWRQEHPGAAVVRHDLARPGLAPARPAPLAALLSTDPDGDRAASPEPLGAVARRRAREALAAGTWVLGAPFDGTDLPAALRTWADQVARVQVCEPQPPSSRRAVVVTAGGCDGATQTPSAREEALRDLLARLGVDDVTVIHADGCAGAGPASADVLERALVQVRELAAGALAAA
jgi:FMN-dependent NADH-azoreductase